MLMRPIAAALAALLISSAGSAADLAAVLDMARDNDPQVRASEFARLAAAETVTQARSVFYPQVSGTADYSRSRFAGSFPTGDGGRDSINNSGKDRSYGLSLRQSIYRRDNYTRLDGARANYTRAEADYETEWQRLLVRVSEAYFGALTAEDALNFSRDEERAVGQQLEQAEKRFEVGLTAITDVHEARARFDGARARVIVAENNLNDAREALRELTGREVPSVTPLAIDIPMVVPQPNDPQQWVDEGVANSPQLAALEAQVLAANAAIETERAGHWPTLDLNVGYNDSRDLGDVRPFSADQSDVRSARVVLTVPIFSGYATSSRVRQSIADRDSARERLDQQRRAIERQTRNAFRAVIAGISEVEARKQAVISADSALEATRAGFEVGTRTIVDVLIAQQVLSQARSDYSNARHNYVLNGLRLRQAAGQLRGEDLLAVNALLAAPRN